jgi:hypothetical protein
MIKRKGIHEVRRSTKGNTYFATGIITDHRKVGCPDVDTIYLQMVRDEEESLFLAVTPEEATILSKMLDVTVYGAGGH